MTGELPPLFDIPLEPKAKRELIIPDSEVVQERITKVYEGAIDSDTATGMTWYSDVHMLCIEIAEACEHRHISPLHVAGIIAVLSPRRSWPDNIKKAREAVQTGTTRGLGHTVRSASTIWHGFDPELVIASGDSNPKVRAFYDNIAYPDTSDRVTVDRHMWTLLFDDRDIVAKADLRFLPSDYIWAAEQVRKAAAEIGVLPHQLQAITWLAWRRKHGIVDPDTGVEQLELGV